MSGKKYLGLSEPKKQTEFLDNFILTSILNFMRSWVEHEKKFYNLGPCYYSCTAKSVYANFADLFENTYSRSSQITI